MTTLEICQRYRNERTSSSTTLAILQDVLRERMEDMGFRTIWLQAHVAGRARIVITLFTSDYDLLRSLGANFSSYVMRFYTLNNFRNFRTDGNLEDEARRIDRMMDEIYDGCLADI